MKKYFNNLLALKRVEHSPIKVDTKRLPLVVDEQNPLLEIIYAPDDVTGLPSSDIAVFMSPKTSPEVRQYIQQNLMQAVTPVKSQFASDVDFETAVSLQRGMSESLSDYASRVSAFAQEQQKLIESSNLE